MRHEIVHPLEDTRVDRAVRRNDAYKSAHMLIERLNHDQCAKTTAITG